MQSPAEEGAEGHRLSNDIPRETSLMRAFTASLLGCVLVLSSACTTTYKQNGEEVSEAYVNSVEEGENPSTVDIHDQKIATVIESVSLDRGSALLRDLQWLIAQKELAQKPILEALPSADDRTRANLLYVLGFLRSAEVLDTLRDNLAHRDPAVRFEAAAGLLQQGDLAAIPTMVGFLESDDRRFRYKAIQVLRETTGRDFGYSFSAPEELRNASVSQWKAWWGAEKERLMFRPANSPRKNRK